MDIQKQSNQRMQYEDSYFKNIFYYYNLYPILLFWLSGNLHFSYQLYFIWIFL